VANEVILRIVISQSSSIVSTKYYKAVTAAPLERER
jgi:hypothetical protein